MAGSGDLQLLNLLRALQTRVGPDRVHVTYGSHVAVSLALGLLLLGGGRFVFFLINFSFTIVLTSMLNMSSDMVYEMMMMPYQFYLPHFIHIFQ